MKKFIVGNVTSYIGQCIEAEHYYCSIYKDIIIDVDSNVKALHRCRTSFEKEELFKVLTENDAILLNKKDDYVYREAGDKTNRFNSLKEINEELLKQFPNENIVTYHECQPYKEMLIKIDGNIKDISYLGEIWSYLPRSVYKDLLPEHFKVKCECGKEYSEEEFKNIMVEYKFGEERTWIQFDTDICECCGRPSLMWNVIL